MAFDLGEALKGVSELGTGREQIVYIRLDLIDDDKENFYSTDEIESLARNIATVGLFDPLRIRDNPEAEGRYKVVSGHRRRLALKLLEQDDPAQWGEAACIHEKTAASPTLQQLRLIFANADNRKMSPSDTSKQAVQVEELLYKLKEEEGYEFPGRMRDHVAQIVGVSKSKLARLKVIREKLAKCFQPAFKKSELNESVAYALAQLPESDQQRFSEGLRVMNHTARWLDAADVEAYKKRCSSIDLIKCKRRGRETGCQNTEAKKIQAACLTRWDPFHCGKCCSSCPELISCKHACPVMADKVAKLKADKREARKQEREAQAEKDRPAVEQISAIWQRFGLARELAFKEIDDCKKAMNIYQFPFDADKTMKLECGEAKIDPTTKLPFGYSCYLSDVTKLTSLADLFDCSLDYLLCRTDVKEMAQAGGVVSESGTMWHPITEEPPVGVDLVWLDAAGYSDTAEYLGSGLIESICTISYQEARWWAYKPEEKE